MNVFSGKEKTYQSWYGIDEETLKINRRFNSAGTEKEGAPYFNETDNYHQTQYQAFYNKKIQAHWNISLALFLTKGKGYYEQYKASQKLASYGLPRYFDGVAEILKTNLVRRLWLDNAYYGTSYSVHYKGSATKLIVGGYVANYDGKHFGEIISAEVQGAVPRNYRWYDLNAFKKEASVYAKWTQTISPGWQTFLDVQARGVNYKINGFRYNPGLLLTNKYFFLNPKAGIAYNRNNTKAYFAFGRESKEPNREDLEAGITEAPKAETLNDFELGVEKKKSRSTFGMNLFYMLYDNQLVLTGKINDVGAYTRTNIKDSYRAGMEVQGTHTFSSWLAGSGNLTISKNKIKNYTEYLDDYDNGGQQTKLYQSSTLPFSPAVTGNLSLNFIPVKNSLIALTGKMISRQFLDNTSDKLRSLHPYYVQDARISYTLTRKSIKSLMFFVQVYNVFSEKYEANGYTFSYINQNKTETQNYYYPMAPINLMFGVNASF
ncbi:MAG: TonB-dependent receptor, partial [Ferruginibacter sp.]